jgi:hypothetical protein
VILLTLGIGHAGSSDGLVAYWSFDDISDLGHDDSGNGNNGTILGPTWTTGQVGTALSFDGIDDIVEIPASPYWDFANPDFSVEFWINNPTSYWDWESIIGNQYLDRGSGWGIWTKQEDIGFEAGGADPQTHQMIRTWDEPLTYGSWHYVVISRKGTGIDNLRIYVDGIPKTTGTLEVFADNDYPLRIGRSYEQYHRPIYFCGLIDEVAIYDVAIYVLNPSEMLSQLVEDVLALNLQEGISNSLDAKIEAALNALDDINENNDIAAINSLNAFINAVEAQCGNKISEEDADALIAEAQKIIDCLTGA